MAEPSKEELMARIVNLYKAAFVLPSPFTSSLLRLPS